MAKVTTFKVENLGPEPIILKTGYKNILLEPTDHHVFGLEENQTSGTIDVVRPRLNKPAKDE